MGTHSLIHFLYNNISGSIRYMMMWCMYFLVLVAVSHIGNAASLEKRKFPIVVRAANGHLGGGPQAQDMEVATNKRVDNSEALAANDWEDAAGGKGKGTKEEQSKTKKGNCYGGFLKDCEGR